MASRKRIRLEMFLSDEQIEMAKEIARLRTKFSGSAWNWREVLMVAALRTFEERLPESLEEWRNEAAKPAAAV